MLVGKIDAQVECLKVVVNAHIERGLPKGALLKQFYDLYHDDVIDEDSFLRWEGDIHDQTPKRAEALKDVSRLHSVIKYGHGRNELGTNVMFRLKDSLSG